MQQFSRRYIRFITVHNSIHMPFLPKALKLPEEKKYLPQINASNSHTIRLPPTTVRPQEKHTLAVKRIHQVPFCFLFLPLHETRHCYFLFCTCAVFGVPNNSIAVKASHINTRHSSIAPTNSTTSPPPHIILFIPQAKQHLYFPSHPTVL